MDPEKFPYRGWSLEGQFYLTRATIMLFRFKYLPWNSQSIEGDIGEDEIRAKWLSFYRDILELQDINLDNFSKIFEFSRAWQIFLDYDRGDNELFNRSKRDIHNRLKGGGMNIDELALFLNRVFYNNSNRI